MKLLGLDYGESKIGLAFGDSESRVAAPFKIIKNNSRAPLVELKKICDEENIEKIIVGLPINHRSKSPDQIKTIQDFACQLEELTGVNIDFQDERFSTQAAQKLLAKNKSKDDDISAMLILQSYLDKNF